MSETEIEPPAPTEAQALDQRLAQRLMTLRTAAGWSLEDLAQRSGISRATLSRLERAETSPTAHLLGRLCAAHGLTLSSLLAEVETLPVRHLGPAQQSQWEDPSLGFRRRMLAPPMRGFATELLECRLQPGAHIRYEHPPVAGLEHHLWLISGQLQLQLDGQVHRLRAGASLSYKLWGASQFDVPGKTEAHYLLAITQARP
ncbi:transcriptional regulator with XRE-family HTH domain [Inhella inkyongensis]|uniref:Transcriptional regulator with XRE-family HTH domain n=1 Tax=Inhella inkyongensis TaxID=392593 RepID=A0A840S188_9BURK|nr:XRE family transcriptional regulator [Inhella inkyongensis]MBB5204887.1 transcriptional regulator with XRE-family HTH domain [Inhella inkyongensis]